MKWGKKSPLPIPRNKLVKIQATSQTPIIHRVNTGMLARDHRSHLIISMTIKRDQDSLASHTP